MIFVVVVGAMLFACLLTASQVPQTITADYFRQVDKIRLHTWRGYALTVTASTMSLYMVRAV